MNGGGPPDGEPPPTPTVTVDHTAFTPSVISVPSGGTLVFKFLQSDHTVKTVSTSGGASPISVNNGGGDFDAVGPVPQTKTVTIVGPAGGQIKYQCGIHGPAMPGTINIT